MYDIAIIGAGAAGLTAAIFARRAAPDARIVLLDGAPKIGAKILISGGGRCNATHDVVTADDFNGNRNAIAKVLRTFTVEQTVAWFAAMGVMMKREETGKLFPTTDRAKTVLDALLASCDGVEILSASKVISCARQEAEPGADHPERENGQGDTVAREPTPHPPSAPSPHRGEAAVGRRLLNDGRRERPGQVAFSPGEGEKVPKADEGRSRGESHWMLNLAVADQPLFARRVILATGGRSVPKTGSDGSGYALARSLGHTVSEVFPALVPLILESGHWMTSLSGTSLDAELSVRATSGRVLVRHRGSLLFTHFGLSGPVVLDISRHWIASRGQLFANFLPGETFESLEASLVSETQRNPRATVASVLRGRVPERLVSAICEAVPLAKITKEERRRIVRALVEVPLPVVHDRGFDFAEVTAGGVPLSEVDLATMASRRCDGLYLCGEILDVDGRIGGYNFQWAWASGRLAGTHAAHSLFG